MRNSLLAAIRSIARLTPRRVRRAYRDLAYRGSARHCPLCGGTYRKFLRAGLRRRRDARCPGCGSLERHRSAWVYLSRFTDVLTRPIRLLHIAPEASIAGRLRANDNIDYLSADLDGRHAMVSMDITDIRYPDDSFDVIYCSHVLEHVPDDVRAMREFRRVLRPGGMAVLQVPLGDRDVTYEDWSIVTPAERLRAFGQIDHVRIYGRDFPGRLLSAGFEVEQVDVRTLIEPEELRRLAIDRDEPLFIARA